MELLTTTAPIRLSLTILLMTTSIAFAWRCILNFRMVAVNQGSGNHPMAIVKGLRGLVISITALAWAAGVYWGQGWLFIIGLIILAQELYEMGVITLIIRSERG